MIQCILKETNKMQKNSLLGCGPNSVDYVMGGATKLLGRYISHFSLGSAPLCLSLFSTTRWYIRAEF